MKIVVSHKPTTCPICHGEAIWSKDNLNEHGVYTNSSFFCEPCRLYTLEFRGGMVAEQLTDESVICPDEILVTEG